MSLLDILNVVALQLKLDFFADTAFVSTTIHYGIITLLAPLTGFLPLQPFN
jgi:hypothetical protein